MRCIHTQTEAQPCYSNPDKCDARCDALIPVILHTFVEMNSAQACGPIATQLGYSRIEITDLNGATVHRRHLNQIHFSEPSMPNVELDDSQTDDESSDDLLTENTVG